VRDALDGGFEVTPRAVERAHVGVPEVLRGALDVVPVALNVRERRLKSRLGSRGRVEVLEAVQLRLHSLDARAVLVLRPCLRSGCEANHDSGPNADDDQRYYPSAHLRLLPRRMSRRARR